MRAVVQRVSQGKVTVDSEEVGAIAAGLVILLGVGHADSEQDVEYLASKIVNLRIFSDKAGKMNLSLLDVKGEALIVSQFTLWGDCRKGRRPSFVNAAPPELAESLYDRFVERVSSFGVHTATGRFGALMRLHLVNDGPVTLILDSRKQ